MCKLNKKIKKLHKEFVKKNGHEPKFADVKVQYDNEKELVDDIIKLRDFDPCNTENDPDDGHFIFCAEGIKGLCEVNGGGHGFTITDINSFYDTY